MNLGIFPNSAGTQYAYATPQGDDRLSGIDDFLKVPAVPAPPPTWQPSTPVQVAYAAPPRPAHAQPAKRASGIWLQLASGPDADALRGEFSRMKSRHSDIFDGIKGYVARGSDRARLVVGPFRGPSDAQIFADDLDSVGINSFRWTNSATDQIVPLGTE